MEQLIAAEPYVGSDFIGNATVEPKCNEVHDFLCDLIEDLLVEQGITLTHYELASVFEAGSLPYDAAAHIYMAIIDPYTREIIWVLDPWRTGNIDFIDPVDNPNGDDPESISP